MSVFQYLEPTFPIHKQESFDEDNIKHLLVDDNFNKADRDKLSHYNKHRLSGSKINVSYKFGLGCEALQLGRLFPDEGIGLQSFRFDMRNPLAKKFYWDTDIENCHYVIALQQCKLYNIKYDNIEKYVNNRDECLSLVSTNRKKAKTEFLKTLYLGNVKLYNEHYNEVDGDISEDGKQFIRDLSNEVDHLSRVIWDANPTLHKLKTGKDKNMIVNKPNPRASLMSLLFQTEERKLILVWDAYLTYNNRKLAVLIHDGGYVEKLDKETEFPVELLEQGSQMIFNTTGYEVKLTQKQISYDWKPNKPQSSQYDVMKSQFEKNTFIVGTQMYNIMTDGQTENIKYTDAKFKFAPLKVELWNNDKNKIESKSFLELWKEDTNRLAYDRVDFYPNPELCPSKVYNLFNGFNAEQFRPEIQLTQEKINELVAPIITQLNYLTKNNADHMLKWFANIIQNPHKKSEVAILIRDEGDLLTEGGGTGKNLMIEFFGYEILGEQYCVVVGDNKELYTNFNSLFEGKLLVFVEEACSKDNHSNNDFLKSKITSKKSNINKKMVAQYSVNDYSNYIFTSNNRNPLPIRQGNRRFWVFDTDPQKRGNVAYFTDLAKHINTPEVKWAFYQYLKTYNTYKTPIEFSANIPLTDAYKEIRMLNAPIYLKWLVAKIEDGALYDASTSTLYNEFSKWVTENKEKSADSMISQTAFGLLLSNTTSIQSDYNMDDIGIKVKKHGYMYMKWNINAVINGLKKLHLLDDNYQYEETQLLV